jgi:hypothetical protein
MKKLIFILFLSSTGWAACPLYTYPENHKIDQEFNNVCENIQNVSNSALTSTSSTTLSGLTVSSLTVTSQAQIRGTKTNDSAAAGYIGEYVESITSLANINTTNVWQDITSISLTAGDWDVQGQIIQQGGGVSQLQAAVSLYSGNTTTDHVYASNVLRQVGAGGAYDSSITINRYRVSINTTTTVYLKGLGNFASGTPQIAGKISARRVR